MIPSSKACVHTIFTVYSLIFGRKTRFSGTVELLLTLLKSEIVECEEQLLSRETVLVPAKRCLALGYISSLQDVVLEAPMSTLESGSVPPTRVT